MKPFLSVLCLCVLLPGSAGILFAQTAQANGDGPSFEESRSWLNDFISAHGGLKIKVKVEEDVIHTFDYSNDFAIRFGDIAKVETWSSSNGSYYVRVTGERVGCESGFDGCGNRESGYIDMELNQEPTKENCERMVKALTHMAELQGAKVNQKEPF